jgi:cysteine-rich repeat protein
MRGGWSARCALTTLVMVGAGSVCARAHAACGDGATDGAETCDDANQVDGDGCTASCQLEAGYLCSGAPSVCCFAEATAAYALLANASYSASEAAITLTPDDIWKEGTAWYRLPLDFSNPFTLSLRIYLGTRDDAPMSSAVDIGADGGSILFQRDPRGLTAKGMYTGSAGEDGRELGANGIVPVVGVEFDTYNNGAIYGDTIALGDEDHTSVFQARVTNQLAPARCMNDAAQCSNFEDGKWHRFDVTWSGRLEHHLGVFIDGKQRIDLAADLIKDYFADDPRGIIFGLSAITGGQHNLHRFCPLAPLGFIVPRDADMDGSDDSIDSDDDGDGSSDRDETAGVFGSDDPGADADTDGVPNYRDADYWRDVLMRASDCVDIAAPIGACDALVESIDADHDGVPNQLDSIGDAPVPSDAGTAASDAGVQLDASTPDASPVDGGSTQPAQGDAGGAGGAPPASSPCVPDKNALTCATGDADGDGLNNAFECPGLSSCRDTDADGVSDYADADSDGDGTPDKTECPSMDACPDLDGDGVPDLLGAAPARKDDGCALASEGEPLGALWLLLLLSARTGWCVRCARARACDARRSLPWSRAARRRPPAEPQSR